MGSQSESLKSKALKLIIDYHISLTIALFLITPFLIVKILLIINSFTLFQPLPDVGYKEWVGFLGSYLGGAITLCGVYLSILYTNRTRIYDAEKRRIQNETKIMMEHINNIDFSFYTDVMREYSKSTADINSETICALEDIIDKIDKKNIQLLKFNSYIVYYSDIMYVHSNCSECKINCILHRVKRDFIENYKKINHEENIQKIRYIILCHIDLLKISDEIKKENGDDILFDELSERIKEIERNQEVLINDIILLKDELLSHNVRCLNDIIPYLLRQVIVYENESINAITNKCPNASRRLA